jgi:hypothetical protein
MQLSDFQDGLAGALMPQSPAGAQPAEWLAALQAQPGFAVYRNTVHKGCIDALLANYPTVCGMVGEDWLRAAAAVFVLEQPPRDARLMGYGKGFAAFLQGFAPAEDLPYLSGVAHLDRCWTESHLAADAPVLDAAWLAAQPPEALGGVHLSPHPAARWAWSDNHPACTLWQRQRNGEAMEAELSWQGDGALLTRPTGPVQWMPLPRAGVTLLNACAAGQPLECAAEEALAADPGADLGTLLVQLLQAGALCPPSARFPVEKDTP